MYKRQGGSEGFVRGSVSAAITIACKSGMLGEALKGISPVSYTHLPSHIRVFSDNTGAFKPEILSDVLHLELRGLNREKMCIRDSLQELQADLL